MLVSNAVRENVRRIKDISQCDDGRKSCIKSRNICICFLIVRHHSADQSNVLIKFDRVRRINELLNKGRERNSSVLYPFIDKHILAEEFCEFNFFGHGIVRCRQSPV